MWTSLCHILKRQKILQHWTASATYQGTLMPGALCGGLSRLSHHHDPSPALPSLLPFARPLGFSFGSCGRAHKPAPFGKCLTLDPCILSCGRLDLCTLLTLDPWTFWTLVPWFPGPCERKLKGKSGLLGGGGGLFYDTHTHIHTFRQRSTFYSHKPQALHTPTIHFPALASM